MTALAHQRFFGIPAWLCWVLVMSALVIALSWQQVTAVLDPSDRFTDQGADGPYEWVRQQDGVIDLGPVLSTLHPGQHFAYISTFCPQRNEEYVAVIRLVRIEDGETLASRFKRWMPGERRCGPIVARMEIPAAATPGIYRLDREALFNIRTGEQTGRRAALQPMIFEVR